MHSPSTLLPLLAALLLLAAAPGCGAIRSTVSIIEADKVIRAAQDAGGAEAAPYPMRIAEDLLAKAREEQGYADYSRSFALAREARAVAQKALDATPTKTAAPSDSGAVVIDPSLWADDDDSAGDDDDSAGDDDDSAGDDPADDDDSAGDDDDSAGDDDDSAASVP